MAMGTRRAPAMATGMATARQNLFKADPQAQFALSLFPEAEKLSELAKNRITKTGR